MTATLPETTGLTGQMLIAGEPVRGSGKPIHAFDPSIGETLEPAYQHGDSSNVDAACSAAATAFPIYRSTSSEQRAQFLEAIASNIEAVKDAIIARATAESGLPTARITGEVGRTTGQLRLFASVLREGSWNAAVIDPALPDRTPAPRPDIRQRSVPLGPVAVFGASNFPLAFSVAGGDTASALAAGCPVVVKGHDAHPGTSELVGRAITAAVASSGLPAGTFSLLFGSGPDLGIALVTDPRIKAVGFTGSRSGGTALVAAAAARPEPIPVYAEMSSINPVFLLDGALTTRGADLGKAFVGSLTMGSGQFCTNPGLVIAADSPGLDTFIAAARDALAASPATPMLTLNIVEMPQAGLIAYTKEVAAVTDLPVIVYNRNNARYTEESAIEVAKIPNVIGFKDGTGDLDQVARIVRAVTDAVGEDFLFFNGLPTAETTQQAYRAIGVPLYSSATFAFAPDLALAFYNALESGNDDLVNSLSAAFFHPLVRLRDTVPGYAVALVKAGVALEGIPAGPVRAPLVMPTAQDITQLHAIIATGREVLSDALTKAV